MFSISYTFKGQLHVFAGRVKIGSHSSCKTSAISIFFVHFILQDGFAEGYVNDIMVGAIELSRVPSSGFAGFGTSGFGLADFDYILVN